MAGYKLQIRIGARVENERFKGLDEALEVLERRGRELAATADRHVIDVRTRRFEPVQQVVGRLELSGPGRARAGIDVRGDGSSECFTGRVRRSLVESRDGESAYDTLRRTLSL
ncbi:MAG: hypothetical protein H0U42_08280 [Thermoleophilaceae bacterium]|nr:hypothetical protein [Thermoleophilaceae bacterium]